MLTASSHFTASPIAAKWHNNPSSRAVSSLAAAPRSHCIAPNRKQLSIVAADASFFTGGLLKLAPICNSVAKKRRGRGEIVSLSAVPTSPGMLSLYIAVGIPLVLGFIDSIFNSPMQQWYFDLKKPKWQPPGPIFGGAWSLLYPLMGLASWLVWVEGGFAKQAVPLTLYAVQLVLNLAWQALFFGAKRLGAAFYDILLLDVVLVATIVKFQGVNEVAANLLKPYLAWVLFATALSWRLWDLNRDLTAGDGNAPPAAAPAS